MAEEPAYMMFARANVRDRHNTGPSVVGALLDRIDALEKKLAEKPSASDSYHATPHVKWVNVSYDENGGVQGYDPVRCSCNQPWRHLP